MNLETTMYYHQRFSVGDEVDKIRGDYNFRGTIVGMFTKNGGSLIRVVVENQDKILHIFSLSQLTVVIPHQNEHRTVTIKEQTNEQHRTIHPT